MTDEQKHQIKSENDAIIEKQGYIVNKHLPILETPTVRTIDEIKGRMAVMNALINIAFGAPTVIIKEWIQKHNLYKHLSDSEKEIVEKENSLITQRKVNNLQWYLESLWAFMWLAKMIDQLDAAAHVGDNQASLLPDLERGDNNAKIDCLKELRSETEIYTMLDYYYRLHWYCEDMRLKGDKAKLNEGQIYERRKALEWAFNRANDWDKVEMHT